MKRFVFPLIAMLAIAAMVVPSVAAASSSKNLVQVAASNPQFSTLVTLVKMAGLVLALSGKSKLTVLAPTNAAFSKVPKTTLKALLKNKKQLRAVLLYHVLKGAVPARTVVKLHSAKTLEGSSIKIRVRGDKVYVNNARVIKTDVKASNGIIHVINAALIPPK